MGFLDYVKESKKIWILVVVLILVAVLGFLSLSYKWIDTSKYAGQSIAIWAGSIVSVIAVLLLLGIKLVHRIDQSSTVA